MNNTFDFIVIGAGISACTFATSLNQRFSDASILLVEHGRRLGGRSTTRKSKKNIALQYDHGLPSISFGKNMSPDLFTFISPLIKSRKLIDITNDILLVNEFGDIENLITNDQVYRGFPYMINFCKELINQSTNPKKIDFLFNTITKSIIRKNLFWELKINDQMIIRSKNLILSSSLLAHSRCLEIFNINSLPLRQAFIEGKDKIVDSIIRKTSEQEYIKRINYVLYVSNFKIVQDFKSKHLQIFFSKVIIDDLNFERIIFQRQIDGSMIIVLHTYYINQLIEIKIETLIKSLTIIFCKQKKFLDLFLHAKLIDTMLWKASQPINNF